MAKIDEMTVQMPGLERIRRAETRAEEMENRYDRLTLDVKRLTEERDAARATIAEEREACALLLEKLAPVSGRFDRNIAEALKDATREIRARGEL